jgi:PAS domain S-box-containing protein
MNDRAVAIEGTARLQALSLELIGERDASALYQKIVDAAAAIMRSQFASMQMLHPERGRGGELRLLAFKGFDPDSARFWEWVRADSSCTCGVALRRRERVIAADVERAGFMAGTEDQRVLLAAGIRAAQTTPLVSRQGAVIGMITTHWAEPHEPSGEALRLFDILARQAADLTERTRAEEALRASEARYASVLGLMPAAVYTIDASGVITYFNEHAAALWGRTPSLGDTDERFCGSFRLWQPDGSALPHEAAPMAIAAREGRSFRNEEVVIERPDGSRITVLVNIDPVRDAAGRVTGAINVFHDVTERRAIALALKSSQERYRAIFEAAGVSIWEEDFSAVKGLVDRLRESGVADLRRHLAEHPEAVREAIGMVRILDLNDASVRLFGAPSKEHLMHSLERVFLPETEQVFAEELVALAEGRRHFQAEQAMRSLTGERLEVLLTVAFPPPGGPFNRVPVTLTDITARKRAEQAMRASEKRYRAVVESQSEMVCRFRPDGTLLFVNGAYARARGATPEALLASNFWDHIQEADHAGVRAMLASMTPEAPEVTIENRLATVDGERWTLWTNRALAFDAQGRLAEAQSTGIDITERKRAEEALREADRRKDEFLAILSHELRNPLAPIRNAVTLLREASEDPAIRGQALPVLERQVAHLIRLVEDLLDVSRIGRGDVDLQRRVVRVADVVAAGLETSRPRIDGAGHALSVEQADPGLAVQGDPVRLAQVLANLLNNAAAYTPPGGRIEVLVRAGNGEVAISVRDNGMGMSGEDLASLFSMFRRGDAARNHPSGFGIGLALSRRLAEMHGGTIDAASDGAGKGAEFTLRLPLVVPQAGAQLPAPPGAQADGASPRRVLVVDDNRDAADSLGLLLRTLGAEVRVAHGGAEALAAFDAHEPSIVVLDVGMPDMSGYDVAREIRSRPLPRRPHLVALTGWGQEDDRRRAREAGFDAHLVKPAELGALEALLASIR